VRPVALQESREMVTWSFSLSTCLCGMFGGLPAELMLAVQCLRQVVARGRVNRGGPCQHATMKVKSLGVHL
jgi:hypothetical protein